jgi:hypothetical protein
VQLEVARRLEPAARIFLEALTDDERHVRRGHRQQRVNLIRLFRENRVHRLDVRRFHERDAGREHLEEHGAKREQIRSVVDFLAARLFR